MEKRDKNKKGTGVVTTVLVSMLLLAVLCSFSFVLGLLIALIGGASGGDAVAVVYVEGVIMSSERVVENLKSADSNGRVKAIVLRVDSPGGGVAPSDEIYNQILKTKKPVVVSMGTLAASGGYYISAPADVIYANPNTLTGSIGVIMEFVDFAELMEKYGVQAEVVKSGNMKDIGSYFRHMTDKERAVFQSVVDDAFDNFVHVIMEGRGMTEEEVLAIADGRVYTGRQAQLLGLVDELGDLPEAIEEAARLGEIEGEPYVIEYHEQPDIYEGLFGEARQKTPAEEIQELIQFSTAPTPKFLYTGQ